MNKYNFDTYYRECRLVLPCQTNDGVPCDDYIQTVRQELQSIYGGFTETAGKGADLHVGEGARIKSPELRAEHVVVFDIAMENSRANLRTLYELAARAAEYLGQAGVYVRWPDNTVNFVGDETDRNPFPWHRE